MKLCIKYYLSISIVMSCFSITQASQSDYVTQAFSVVKQINPWEYFKKNPATVVAITASAVSAYWLLRQLYNAKQHLAEPKVTVSDHGRQITLEFQPNVPSELARHQIIVQQLKATLKMTQRALKTLNTLEPDSPAWKIVFCIRTNPDFIIVSDTTSEKGIRTVVLRMDDERIARCRELFD